MAANSALPAALSRRGGRPARVWASGWICHRCSGKPGGRAGTRGGVDWESDPDFYDLFIGEVLAAWADERVFRNGHWEFDTAPDELRTLHYVAGGQFYATGASVTV